jgi:hypothetical protein
MKKPVIAILACGLLGTVFIVGRSDGHDPLPRQVQTRIQWEYREIGPSANELGADALRRLGDEGWEMCGVRQRGSSASLVYFKREKLPGGAPEAVVGDPITTAPWGPSLTPTDAPADPRPTTALPPPPGPSVLAPTSPQPIRAKPIGSTGELPPGDATSEEKLPQRHGRSY